MQYKKTILWAFSLILLTVVIFQGQPSSDRVFTQLFGDAGLIKITFSEDSRFSTDSHYLYELDFSKYTKENLIQFIEKHSFGLSYSGDRRHFASYIAQRTDKTRKFKGYVLYKADIVLPVISKNKEESVSLFFHEDDINLPVFIEIVEF